MSGGLAVGQILHTTGDTSLGGGGRYLPFALDSSSRVIGSSLTASRATACAGANFFDFASCAGMVDLCLPFLFFFLFFPLFSFPSEDRGECAEKSGYVGVNVGVDDRCQGEIRDKLLSKGRSLTLTYQEN